MCGRMAQSEPSRYAQRLNALVDPELEWRASWNIGPTSPVLGVRERHGERVLAVFSWGLLPGWCNDPKAAARAFNARVESVATKPMFRQAFQRRRLLVPVDGFYEWAAVGGSGSSRKQPYFFERADGDPVVLAGLWEYWVRGDERRRSATVLTSRAGPDMQGVHDRQPVVLEPADWTRWLDPDVGDDPDATDVTGTAGTATAVGSDADLVRELSEPRGGVLVHHPVGADVGSVRNDGPHLVEAVAAMPGAPA